MTHIFSPGRNTHEGHWGLFGVSGYFWVSKHTDARKLYVICFYLFEFHPESFRYIPEYPAHQYKLPV